MDKLIHLQITDKEIADATPKDPFRCFTANALTKMGLSNVCATYHEISWKTDTGNCCWAITPREVQTAMISFDEGRTIEPFDVELQIQI